MDGTPPSQRERPNPLLSRAGGPHHICTPLQHAALVPSAILADLFRLALLLTGRSATAAELIAKTFAEDETQLAQIRDEAQRKAWLAMRLRDRCLQAEVRTHPSVQRLIRGENGEEQPEDILGIEAYILAEHFHCLPEPVRTALALFYLDLFPACEIARLLKLEVRELGNLLSDGRSKLRHSLAHSHPHTA